MFRYCPKCQMSVYSKADCPQCGETLVANAKEAAAPIVDEPQPSYVPPKPTVPGFEIVRFIAEGGMGEVWEGKQKSLGGRRVAIKVMKKEKLSDPKTDPRIAAEMIGRFKREALALAALPHDNIVNVIDFCESPDSSYLVMEYVEGSEGENGRPQDLSQLIKQGQLNSGRSRKLLLQIGQALTFAHENGIVHRDVKPANVLIDRFGNAKVADFGLAMVNFSKTLTPTFRAIGTLVYMAPEQFGDAKSVDVRADVYSTGVMLHQMLTGQLPQETLKQPSEIVVGLEASWDEIIKRSMQKDRELRYKDMAEMMADVETLTAAGTTARPLPKGATSDALSSTIVNPPSAARGSKTSFLFPLSSFLQGPKVRGWIDAGREFSKNRRLISAALILFLVMGIGYFSKGLWSGSVDGQPDGNGNTSSTGKTGISKFPQLPTKKIILDRHKDGELATLDGHSKTIVGVAFHPNGNSALSISDTYDKVRLMNWDLETLKGTSWHDRTAYNPSYVTFSPQGDHFACFHNASDGAPGIAILNQQGKIKNLLTAEGRFQAARFVFSVDGNHLLSAGPDGHVRYWKNWKSTPDPISVKEYADAVYAIALTPDGKYCVASSGHDAPTIDVFELNGRLAGQFKGQKYRLLSVAVSMDGRRMASFDVEFYARGAALRMWDFDEQKLLKTTEIEVQTCCAFSRDARFAVVGNSTGVLSLYNLETGKKVESWRTAQGRPITAIAISADSRFALTGDKYAKVRYWGLPDITQTSSD